MRKIRIRLTVFRVLLAVAIAAILLHLAIEPFRDRARDHYNRCVSIAETHASLGAAYRKNAQGDPLRLKIAAWHEHMRREFEQAAQHPELPMPRSQPFPPRDWVAPADETTPD